MTSVLKVDNIQNSSGTSALSINTSGLLLPKNVALQVEAVDTDQAISGANVLVQWETVELDTISGWDSTNHRYKPNVAGWYLFGGQLRATFATVNAYYLFKVTKNNSDEIVAQFQLNSDNIIGGVYSLPSGLHYLNGTSDYLEVRVEGDEAYTVHDHSTRPSKFWVMLAHQA
jgi:hypothetical protein